MTHENGAENFAAQVFRIAINGHNWIDISIAAGES